MYGSTCSSCRNQLPICNHLMYSCPWMTYSSVIVKSRDGLLNGMDLSHWNTLIINTSFKKESEVAWPLDEDESFCKTVGSLLVWYTNCAFIQVTCVHRYGKVKLGKIVLLLKIFLNKATSDCFVNLSPIFTIFNIMVNDDVVHISHHFGCHENYFGMNLCVSMVNKLYY